MDNYRQNHRQGWPSKTGVAKFKVVLLGEAGVGKSAIFIRLKDNIFAEHLEPTVGIESCSKVVSIDGEKITLQVWDTAGAEKYRTLTRNYYRNTHALFLVYSMDNPASLHYLTKWIEDSIDAAPNALMFLIGNKSDLERSVTEESVVDFAEAHGVEGAFNVSAKTGDGLNYLQQQVGRKMQSFLKFPPLQDSLFDERMNINVHNKYSNTTCVCSI